MKAKKVAVVVRDRQEEAYRMVLGLITLNIEAEVFLLNSDVEVSYPVTEYIAHLAESDVPIFSNRKSNESLQYLSEEEIGLKLFKYDQILAY